MSESKEENSGAWSRVPTWDGDPKSWRAFQREMEWWLEALDVNSTTRYNLAARWLLRQSGIVRQRGEEFTPSELAHQPEVTAEDPVTKEMVVITPADPLKGIRKLMKALESINGKTVLDKRGDLRNSFYLELRRKPQERISEFCTRFRTAVAELRMEGVVLPSGELAWFLKQKLGLDAIRQQLLETALQGRETYEETEVEVLRLFKDLHVADPLFRRAPQHDGSGRNPVLNRFLAQQRGTSYRSASSVAPSTSSFMTSRSGSTQATSRGPPQRRVFGGKQAFVAEADDEDEPDGQPDVEPGGEDQSLDEVLQAEAECLAAELEAAAEEDLDEEVLQDVEESVETAAEALLTMREARHKLAEVRKDRGYGKPGSESSTSPPRAKAGAKKSSGKHPCFDCNQHGHWAGDSECPKPGAGLGRKGPRKAKSVKVVETLNTEHVVEDIPPESHEALAVTCVSKNLSVGEALHAAPQREVHAVSLGLSNDKKLVGALDSACNRTVTGNEWLQGFLHALESAPAEVRSLVRSCKELETFRFGDGGTQISSERWRLPVVIGGVLACIWVSVVPVASLGLLLGRDFLESIGATMSFSKRLIKFDFLNSSAVPLKQLAAGHFMLRLVPNSWPGPSSQRWKRLGIDGVLELQVSVRDWLSKKLAGGKSGKPVEHEHFLAETSLEASCHVQKLLVDSAPSLVASTPVQAPRMDPNRVAATTSTSSPTSLTSTRTTSSPPGDLTAECLVVEHGGPSVKAASKVAKVVQPTRSSRSMALLRTFVVACAATWIATPSLSIPSCRDSGAMETAGYQHGKEPCSPCELSGEGGSCKELHCSEPSGLHLASESFGIGYDVPGRSSSTRDAGWPFSERSAFKCSLRSLEGSQGRSFSCDKAGTSRSRSSGIDRASRRSSSSSTRSSQVGGIASCSCGRKDDCAPAQGSCEAHGGDLKEQRPSKLEDRGIKFQSVVRKRDKGAKASTDRRPHEILSTTCVPQSRSTAAVSRHDAASADRSGESSRSSSCATRSASSRVLLGSRPRSSPSRARCGDDSTDPRADDDGWRYGHGRCLPRKTGGPVWRAGHCGPDQRASGNSSGSVIENNPFELYQTLKSGQAKLISDAWEKHVSDCKRISQSPQKMRETMIADYEAEMQGYINDEVFMHTVDFTTSLKRPSSSARTSFLKASSASSPLVGEVYTNTQRVMKEAAGRGHRVGTPMSLENGWDFLRQEDRERAKALVRKEKPFFLVLAFPCGPFSPLQRLNPSARHDEILEAGRTLMRFALELAQIQVAGGRHYVLENPLPSGAWKELRMRQFFEDYDPYVVDFDQCSLGLRSLQGNLHKKPTRMASSSSMVTSLLDGRKCTRTHVHDPVIGGAKVTVRAGHYPGQLARLLVQGMERQFNEEVAKSSEVMAVNVDVEEDLGAPMAVGALPEFDSDSELEEKEEQKTPGKIPASIRATVARLHENTGHRSNKRLARALNLAGAPEIVVRAAKQHKCSVCQERVPPKPQRPASLPQPRDVSDQVHVDMLEAYDAAGVKYYVIHAIDFCTRFQMSQVLEHKSAESVLEFFKTRWLPVFGPMRVLVCDQGREFISHALQEFCTQNNVLLWHIGVGAPWQNGICERSGGTLKAILAATVMANSVIGRSEMELALGEATSAYNMDVNDSGMSPSQAALGRQPRVPGDVLNGVRESLGEHDAIENGPNYARLMALRETAKVAMTRLHFSRGLRRAELARSRESTVMDVPSPGDIVYFYRFQKYNSKLSGNRRRLALKKWHGPGLMVAVEPGSNGDGANAYVSFKEVQS